MNPRAKRIYLKEQVAHRHEANALLTAPGVTALVFRGVARSIAMACPDGCGEQLTVNLDSRAGPAWRYYVDGEDLSLFPSVWRETGCKSHFIVWRSKIYWCDWHDELDAPQATLVEQVEKALTAEFTSFVAIADQLGAVPWAVLSACKHQARRGIAERGTGKLEGHFRRLSAA